MKRLMKLGAGICAAALILVGAGVVAAGIGTGLAASDQPSRLQTKR